MIKMKVELGSELKMMEEEKMGFTINPKSSCKEGFFLN
jgi:hypothetical protein